MKHDRFTQLSPQELLETKPLADFYRQRARPVKIPSFEKVWKEAEEQFKPQHLRESYSAKKETTEVPAFMIPASPQRRVSHGLSWQSLQIGFSVLALATCCFAISAHFRTSQVSGQIPSITMASYFSDSFLRDVNSNQKLDTRKGFAKDEISADFLLDIKYETDSLLEE